MKKSLCLSALALLSFCSLSHAQSMQALDKQQVTKVFGDKTITTVPMITLNDKLQDNTFTGYFSKDGKLNGQFTNQPDNGPQNDEGKWTVKGDGTLCATWQHWNGTKPICVSVYKTNNSLILINTKNHNFETMVLTDNIKSGNQLTH